jgi:hypothetical protein
MSQITWKEDFLRILGRAYEEHHEQLEDQNHKMNIWMIKQEKIR